MKLSALLLAFALTSLPAFADPTPTNGSANVPLAGAVCNGSSCKGFVNDTNHQFIASDPDTHTSLQALINELILANSNFATAAKQDTGNGTLASILAKQPMLNGDGGAPAHVTNFPSTQGVNLVSAIPTPVATSGPITVQDTGSTTTVGAYNVSYYTGTPTVGSVVAQAVSGIALARVQVAGAFTGTLQIEASQDGGTTYRTSGGHVNGSVFTAGTFTAPGSAIVGIGGATNIRARATTAMTGTATVTMAFSNDQTAVYVLGPVALKDNATGNQASINSSGQVAVNDPNSAAFGGAITVTPGTPFTAGRSIGFVCTTAGNITVTLSDASTMTFPIVVSASLQTLPLAATNIALGGGTGGTFWSLK
jgi:hypothetical protein